VWHIFVTLVSSMNALHIVDPLSLQDLMLTH